MARVASDDALDRDDMVMFAVRRSVDDAMSHTVRPEALDSVRLEAILFLRRWCRIDGCWNEDDEKRKRDAITNQPIANKSGDWIIPATAEALRGPQLNIDTGGDSHVISMIASRSQQDSLQRREACMAFLCGIIVRINNSVASLASLHSGLLEAAYFPRNCSRDTMKEAGRLHRRTFKRPVAII